MLDILVCYVLSINLVNLATQINLYNNFIEQITLVTLENGKPFQSTSKSLP